VDAIVNSTNENMTDNTGLSGLILDAAGPELLEEICKCESCRTGEVRVTKGYKLPARFIFQTVGPRYNDRYKTAAENALHNCYRCCLEMLKENNLHTISFPVINSLKRGYPPDPGSHIAIRTIRRFLEHWGKDVHTVVFCVCNSEEFRLYSRVLALYFPRNRKELQTSKEELPRDTGNEFGETVIEERKIRISAFPGGGAPTSIETPVPIIPPPPPENQLVTPRAQPEPVQSEKLPATFAMMKTDFDEERKKKLEHLSQDAKDKMLQQQLYMNHLFKAQGMDLSDIARLNVIYEAGKDPSGRPIVMIVGNRLPLQRSLLDRVFLYMIRVMDRIVENSYVVVYVHTNMESRDTPEFGWMKQIYNIMDYKYGDHLNSFFVVHPTFWLKIFEGVISTFMTNENFWTKVRYIDKLDDLYDSIEQDQIVFPDEVYQYDFNENGPSNRPASRTRRTTMAQRGGPQAESIVNEL